MYPPSKTKPLRLKDKLRCYSNKLTSLWRKAERLDHLGGRVLPCDIFYNRFGGYCVPISARHRPAAQRVIRGEVHELKTIEYICQKCGSGDIIHGGTFFGDFLPALSARCDSEALVWAFEPNPESFRCAEITLLLNSLTNVRLFNAAMGSHSATGRILILDRDGYALGGGSRLVGSGSCPERTTSVNILPVDRVVPAERKVSVVHLDVEGYEEEALSGALNTIRRCRPCLILENLPSNVFLENTLNPMGYKVTGRIERNWLLSALQSE